MQGELAGTSFCKFRPKLSAMKKLIVVIALFLHAGNLLAQNSPPVKPCSSPEASQFDFWVGDWVLTWNDTSHGTNRVLKIMDGCAVNENFNSPSMNYTGSSWSMFNARKKTWQQTWVDNQGTYIVLTGQFANNEMTLTTGPQQLKDGKEIISRMVFFNITSSTFDWRWESTTDSSATWQTNWLIHYKRKGS